MNIVLFVIDTLRYDYIGAHGNDWIETPNLDRLAEGSMLFDRAFSASFPTIPHRTDVLTGKYGSPFHTWMPLPFDWPTAPRMLADAGFCTQLIHDTPHLVNGGHNFDWPFHAWTFVRGAEVDRPWIDDATHWPENWCRDPLCDGLAPEEKSHWGNLPTYVRANRKRKTAEDWNCARLFSTVADFFQDNKSRDNFFLWVDCFDPHEPWDAPADLVCKYDRTEGYDGRIDPRFFGLRNHENLPEAGRKRVAAHYAAKVSLVDREIGKALDALESTGLAKHTAVIFTADHGTNVGERGRFGKGVPVRQQEAHVPLLVRVPGGPTGRSQALVQPQDIFATILSLADVPRPAALDCRDALALARDQAEPREVALASTAAAAWQNQGILFTVFDAEWYLQAAIKPEDSILTRLGSLDEVQADHADVVERLHKAGLAELDRRGADPQLMRWLRSRGDKPFPARCRLFDGWPAPAAYTQYFNRVYLGK